MIAPIEFRDIWDKSSEPEKWITLAILLGVEKTEYWYCWQAICRRQEQVQMILVGATMINDYIDGSSNYCSELIEKYWRVET